MPSSGFITPNQFQGSDSDRINQAVMAAAKDGLRVVIPRRNESADGPRDVWLLDSAILLVSGTTLELDNCRLKLSDRCRDNFIRSANCGLGITEIEPVHDITIRGLGHVVLEGADHPRATGDSAKTIGQRSYGTDAGVEGESQTGDWRNIGILLAYVDGFRIENLKIVDSHCWAISLERCSNGVIRDLSFASEGSKLIDGKRETILNQDGLDLRQGCHDILIDGLTGHTGDDLLAMTAIFKPGSTSGSDTSTMVSAATCGPDGVDDIRNIIARNLRGTAGPHHVVRFLNAGGLRIHDVVLDGLIDTAPDGKPGKATVKIGDANPAWGGVTPLGDTTRLVLNNIIGASRHTILIAGSLTASSISNVVRKLPDGDVITYESGHGNVVGVVTANLCLAAP